MYIPANNVMAEPQALADFIARFGFGLLVGPSLEATHLPMIYVNDNPHNKGVLYGHMAKANTQWQSLEDQRVLVVFRGPHSYISPTWYDTQPAVPTWNYAAVHCYGRFQRLTDEATMLWMNRLISQYEPQLHDNMKLIPQEFKHKLAAGVVGFAIELDDIQGKEKLGQHRSKADQAGVLQALQQSANHDASALADYMQSRKLGTGQ